MSTKIGVYVCHCGANIANTVDVVAVKEFAEKLPNVAIAREYKYMCSDPGQDLIKKDIKEFNLDRVVIASCSPLLHEPTFRNACEDGGLNPYYMQMVNIREQCSWVHNDKPKGTEKAKSLVNAAVNRVLYQKALEKRKAPIEQKVLIVGGGIAGIEAALKIANSGKKVVLVEKEPSIGGHMAKLDKTFPTLDCSACILTPKMSEVGRHPNITLHTYSEVVNVAGYIGNFTVTIKKKPRYVIEDKCISCQLCVQKCPAKIPSEFDEGLCKRGAIYTPFAQAVPSIPVIDRENCTYFKTGKCQVCKKVCSVEAIDFEQKETIIEDKFGAIILATGFKLFDSSKMPQYGYGKLANVLTSLEFERLCNASGPTNGKIKIGNNGHDPKSVAIIHCVGSRDENHNAYCSRVCCMYALKFAHLVKEKTGAEVWQFYIDMRTFGKGYEEFYDRLLKEGVKFMRGKVAEVSNFTENTEEEGKLIVKCEDTLNNESRRIPVDMVVLCGALEPTDDMKELNHIFSVSCSEGGFFREKHPKLAPIATATDGIYIAGACQGPKDIPDTVAQGLGAAGEVLSLFDKGEVEIEPITIYVNDKKCSGCKICISMCPYSAIEFDETNKRSKIIDALCKGCGTCAATCPSGSMTAQGFSDEEILAELKGVLAPV